MAEMLTGKTLFKGKDCILEELFIIRSFIFSTVVLAGLELVM
jgi:hypothetical protein